MAIDQKQANILGSATAKAISSLRRSLNKMERRLTPDESAVLLSAFADHVAPLFALKIAEAMVGATAQTPSFKSEAPKPNRSPATARGQFAVKPELFEQGRRCLENHKDALLAAIDSGVDTFLGLKSALTAEGFEIACMVQVLVNDGVIESVQHPRRGKRPIQKYRLVRPEDVASVTEKPDDAIVERTKVLVSARGESFVYALGPGPLTRHEMAQKILYSYDDTELLARALAERGQVVIETVELGGQRTSVYSLPKPKPTPMIPIVQHPDAKVEAPSTDEGWRHWANEKRHGSPTPLSFGQLTYMAHRRFEAAPDWPTVFAGFAELPSIGGQKPSKIDLAEQVLY